MAEFEMESKSSQKSPRVMEGFRQMLFREQIGEEARREAEKRREEKEGKQLEY